MTDPAPPSPAIPARKLPGVRAALDARRRPAQLGLRWAAVVFCTFGAPPALVLGGLLHPGSTPVAFWLGACAFLFTGLALAASLPPLPPRRVLSKPDDEAATDWFAEPEGLEPALPGIVPGMSRAAVLEQLAKLREQGDLSGSEYLRARRQLVGD